MLLRYGAGDGMACVELRMDLAAVFKRTGTALFEYVQNTRILNSCYVVILKTDAHI
jgi:hypothetical protein